MSLDESQHFWNAYVREEALPADPNLLVMQLRGKPSQLVATLKAGIDAFDHALQDVRVSPGLGTVRLVARTSPENVDSFASAIRMLGARS